MKMGDMNISFDVDTNKMYCLGFDGGEGKSRLFRLLSEYKSIFGIKDDIVLIKYDIDLSEQYVIGKLSSNCKLVLIDKFDLLCTNSIIDKLNSMDCLRLIDVKDSVTCNKMKIKLAEIEMNKNDIIVRALT